ncbi:hypothetical protein J0871_01090 [Salegentibacter sp. BDJ18]|uniref:hypothetical protein n=1 Tax=Salegentibacter sp. BDJ18 TaxID=2816376 RepID=UPI001AAFFA0C|nr:hypothetical protein [Salegentibacter sp. BDJ18]MBO2542999.1 hypothetical protein [Salegentibacter sp. BDJ18]
MKGLNIHMKPQDILLLLKLISLDDVTWKQKYVAEALGMSQSEVSESVARSKYSGLLDPKVDEPVKVNHVRRMKVSIAN